ncbi:MerR family transcriptional regulator [Nocardia sp. alder85J]|uniref:MerR family transcriptional regulator n=1 Tax=Nocardia sp. alder85J TaxID=2862949 RepID=UPI001CD6CBB7|nr:MerR family transcriptional regulator [Nocardia sp. alder85J]MCX4092211.1 MerR family transcriptional regulator [Nocardia sp. alder85J]
MQRGDEYTIDELARAAGTTVRSVRVYHERGVLPPPQVKGRTGFYGPDHLNRVRTISRLLDRGIKLNGIKELLNAWDRGDDLGHILGVAEDPAGTGTPDNGTITATELEQRFRGVPSGLARVVALGLYEPVDATVYRVADGQLLRTLDRLVDVGVPVMEALVEIEKLHADCDRVARRFADLFRRTGWVAFQQSDRGPTDRAILEAQLEVVRAVPGQAGADLTTRLLTHYLDQDSEVAEVLAQA